MIYRYEVAYAKSWNEPVRKWIVSRAAGYRSVPATGFWGGLLDALTPALMPMIPFIECAIYDSEAEADEGLARWKRMDGERAA